MTVIVALRRFTDAVEQALAQRFTLRGNPDDRPLAEDEVVRRCAGADVLCPTASDRVSGTLIERLPASVRLIASYGAGIDHIDRDAAARRGIAVSNTPAATTEDTADLAMGLIVATCRRFAEGDALLRTGTWQGVAITLMLGTRVSGKTLGIVGMGRIGAAVARRARGFDMTVLYHGRTRRQEAEAALSARFCASLDDLLRESDVVSLHCPLSETTRHLIDSAALARMKPSAVLINAARGPVVDEAALIAALQDGTIAAAGLDVYEFEPSVAETLRALPNTVLLPHLGTATHEARDGMGMRMIANIESFLATGRPLDAVPP